MHTKTTVLIKLFSLNYYNDWNKFTLITPADKEGNISFYKKCGFEIQSTEMDGNVKVVRLVTKR